MGSRVTAERQPTWERETKRGLGRVKQLVGRELAPTWRYGVNLGPTLAYRRRRPIPAPAVAATVASLDADGVAVTSVEDLGLVDQFAELGEAVARLEGERAADIERARALAADRSNDRLKTFYIPLLGERPVIDPASPFVRFAALPALRAVADHYYRMATQLRDLNVWRNFATDAPPHSSQLWHRDWREDHLILKVFVYLSDVTEDSGPFSYARGTHAKAGRRIDPPGIVTNMALRSTDSELAQAVSPDRWLTVCGTPGTVVFADTTGIHRGGWARGRDRVLFTALYGSLARPRGGPAPQPGAEVADPDLAFALNLTRSAR
jgi:hypothetical protein